MEYGHHRYKIGRYYVAMVGSDCHYEVIWTPSLQEKAISCSYGSTNVMTDNRRDYKMTEHTGHFIQKKAQGRKKGPDSRHNNKSGGPVKGRRFAYLL